MPVSPPLSPPGSREHDNQGSLDDVLARNHLRYQVDQGQMPHMQRECPLPATPATNHTREPQPPLQRPMCRLFQSRRVQLPGDCGQVFWLADSHPSSQGSDRPSQRVESNIRRLRHPRHHHHRWRPRVHCPLHQGTPSQLGSQTPTLLGLQPPFEQQGRDSSQVYEKTHCREHRPRRHTHLPIFQGHTGLPEHPSTRHKDVPSNTCPRTPNPRPPTNDAGQPTATPPYI